MSEFYSAYLYAMQMRDETLSMLFLIALVVILAWVLLELVTPKPWRFAVRSLYIVAGVILFLITLSVSLGGVHV